MKYLITGNEGFVGRHLQRRLTEEGHQVVGTERLEQFITSQRIEHNRHKFDVTVHLAANIVNVDTRMRQGVDAFRDTILDYKFCEYVEQYPPTECAVFLSSCAVDHPADAYGAVKIMLERYTKRLADRGVPVVVLRPFSGYGADQSLEYPFPAIIDRAIRKEDPLVVWGGSQIRDWLYISDLVDAIVHGAKCFPRDASPIEIGTGVGTDFFCLADKIRYAVGSKVAIEGDTSKATASMRRVALTGRALSHGWQSRYTLEQGIERVLSFRGITPVPLPETAR